MKMPKQELPDTGFWMAQILWFACMFILAVAVFAYWWCWGMRWIDNEGTAMVPIAALVAIAVEMWAIVYFKISVPEDDTNVEVVKGR